MSRDGWTGKSKVLQEVLADLKIRGVPNVLMLKMFKILKTFQMFKLFQMSKMFKVHTYLMVVVSGKSAGEEGFVVAV